jgi:hypothetical protein
MFQDLLSNNILKNQKYQLSLEIMSGACGLPHLKRGVRGYEATLSDGVKACRQAVAGES